MMIEIRRQNEDQRALKKEPFFAVMFKRYVFQRTKCEISIKIYMADYYAQVHSIIVASKVKENS